MIKVGIFSITNISPSETFIKDIIDGLRTKRSLEIFFISGSSSIKQSDTTKNFIYTGFYDSYPKLTHRIYKVASLKDNYAEKVRLKFNKWKAKYKLKKCVIPEIDVAYIEYATSAVLLIDYLEEFKKPIIVHVHGYDITESLNDKAYAQEIKKLFNKVNIFITASNYMKRRLILLGCDENKIKVIRIGITNNILPINRKERLTDQPSVVFLGRLTGKKNPIALLHAFKIVNTRIPNSILSIIGSGPLENEVKNEIIRLGIDESVILHGVLTREQSYPIISTHWVYAQHSVTSITGDTEGFAISIAEAALHELPIVSTIHNGITENVINGKTGFLVPEYDYESMAERIIYLIEHPIEAEQMGKAGREYILKLCEPEQRVLKIESLLKELARK